MKWKDQPPIFVNDPTLKVRIIRIEPDPELAKMMRYEMERSKRLDWLPFVWALVVGGIAGALLFFHL